MKMLKQLKHQTWQVYQRVIQAFPQATYDKTNKIFGQLNLFWVPYIPDEYHQHLGRQFQAYPPVEHTWKVKDNDQAPQNQQCKMNMFVHLFGQRFCQGQFSGWTASSAGYNGLNWFQLGPSLEFFKLTIMLIFYTL